MQVFIFLFVYIEMLSIGPCISVSATSLGHDEDKAAGTSSVMKVSTLEMRALH